MKTFEGIEQLSPAELQAFYLLERVEMNSVWGHAINHVVKAPNVCKFRMLVCDLKSQANDNVEVMRSILGDAYTAIVQL